MTEIELKDLIKKRESQTLEFKESTGEKKEICETICAFANSDGGTILVGIKNDGSLSKTTLTEKSQTDITDLFTNFKPKLTSLVSFEIINIDNFVILTITVKKAEFDKNCYKNTFWKRVGASNKDISEEVLTQFTNRNIDWSAEICKGATIEDLDEGAMEIAKIGYIEKQGKTEEDKKRIGEYSNQIFLDEARITINGKITNAAILLLGKEKSQHYLAPSGGAEIFWREMTSGDDISFKMPLLKSIHDVVLKITTRNIELSLKVLGQPIMHKIKENYSKNTLRECVANCVAHQDYTQSSRILIYETRNQNIIFENAGASLYSKDEFNQIRLKKKVPDNYRNGFLRNAMEQVGLIEAKGTGHYKIYQYNTNEVYLPLPEVDWKNQKKFVLTIYGASLDEKFAEILQEKTDLEPEAILLLDQVQKGFKIDQKIFTNLKKQGLVEGTPTKGKLSLEIMKLMEKENEYIDQKMDDEDLKWNICKKIQHCNKGCSRQEIYDYLEKQNKFPLYLNNNQKYIKLTNILTKLKNDGSIDRTGGKTYATWKIIKQLKIN